ncbi:RluA family pseudouridine synthase [Olsenella sp. DSM 107455]|uniref:RNA pseudouridylate synthase n=1 Tax=Thermophilibacter gallinarum TaxID=2779357 RepID=A0ABR9QSU3_9ACTN|nr:RluA family pseudouridine synthase [Thermophilibacter gallinarum]MBE5024164.1 RluA family pseudouridine synthase [Thermophilibacter gallinarum]
MLVGTKGGGVDGARIIYEDEVLLACDKPAGMLVHGDGTGARTLTDVVAEHLAAEGRPEARPQAVQRLDVGTTGLVLFSLDRATQPALDAQVAGHAMNKTYLAVVRGAFPGGERLIDRPIGRDRHDARRMRACRPGQGKPAETRVRRVASSGGRSLLRVELLTGRRHQIRVHLASMGFPIVGDELYGGARRTEGLLLHAWREEVVHPVSGELLRLETAWPERLWPSPPPEARARH